MMGALDGGQWRLVALCLLWGLVEALSKLPPDAVAGLVEVLDAEKES